ncbi:MAG: tetratricopeptide repeat protein, partial [Candidatus Gracilibacteria bacterium]
MKKILIILWTIIIVGIIFITYSLLFSSPAADTPLSKLEKISRKATSTDTLDTTAKKTYGEYLDAGNKYFDEENYTLAATNYKYAAATNENLEILIKLGESYLHDNQYEKSKSTFQKAEKLKPDSLAIKLGEIKSFLGLRDIENAKTLIWSLDPNTPEIKYYRAVVLILYKEFNESQKLFSELTTQTEPQPDQKIIDNAQKFVDRYVTFNYFKESSPLFLETMLAKTMTEVNENGTAIPLLYDVLSTQANYRDAWIILGYAYLKTGQSTDAIDALNRAKDLDPEKSETLFYLGLAYYANNDTEKAIHYIEEAEKKGYPTKDLINLKLGELYAIQGKYRTAEKKYEQVIALNPSDINLFVKAIWMNIEKIGDAEKAISLADKAIASFPNDPMSYNLKGWALTANE